jgi:hypothetical protein
MIRYIRFIPPTAGSRPPLLILCSPVAEDCAILTARRSVTEPRRAHARRSLLCIRSPLNNVRSSRDSVRITEPRRADARRSRLNVRSCIAKNRFSPADIRTPTQERGASAPRGFANALASAFPAHYGQRSPNQNHGGLTNVAPVNVRLCIAKIVFSPAGIRTPTEERGRQPPVGSLPRLHWGS